MSERTFSPVTVAWLVGVGVVSFCAFLVLSAYAPELRRGSDGRAHALSESAVGYAGVVRLLRATGRDVTVVRAFTENARDLVVLTPDDASDAEALVELKDKYAGDPVLVVLPKWSTLADPQRPTWVLKSGAVDDSSTLTQALSGEVEVDGGKAVRPRVLSARAPLAFADWRAPPIDRLRTLSGPGLTALLTDEKGRPVLARLGVSSVYVLADPDLLSNHGLKTLDGARHAVALIGTLADNPAYPREEVGAIVFDTTLNGFGGGRSLLKLAFEPPFLAATLCALAATALMGLHAASRFGPHLRPERALALGKRALADNSAALIRLARREHRFGGRYAAVVAEQAAREAGVPRTLDDAQRAEALDRLGRGQRFTALADALARASDRATLLSAAQALHRWKSEIVRVPPRA